MQARPSCGDEPGPPLRRASQADGGGPPAPDAEPELEPEPELDPEPVDPVPMCVQWWVPPDDVEPLADGVLGPDEPVPVVVPAVLMLGVAEPAVAEAPVVELDAPLPVDVVDADAFDDDVELPGVELPDVPVTAPAMAAPPSTSPVAIAPVAMA